jgi:hypothetical protein
MISTCELPNITQKESVVYERFIANARTYTADRGSFSLSARNLCFFSQALNARMALTRASCSLGVHCCHLSSTVIIDARMPWTQGAVIRPQCRANSSSARLMITASLGNSFSSTMCSHTCLAVAARRIWTGIGTNAVERNKGSAIPEQIARAVIVQCRSF